MAKTDSLVSIIMPAYNAEQYIEAAIQTVLDQTHENWELLVVDNNSSDATLLKARSFQDPRIKVLSETNQGVSHARNTALQNMQGDFFCFLDADDLLPKDSLKSRLEKFDKPDIHFVDGKVLFADGGGIPTGKEYVPSYEGAPLKPLLRLDERCLFGLSWMIRRDKTRAYTFDTEMSHAEDLYFYLNNADQGNYTFTESEIYIYRRHESSAMTNLAGLESGYKMLLQKVKKNFSEDYDPYLKRRIIRIMFLSWLFDGKNPFRAITSVFRFLSI